MLVAHTVGGETLRAYDVGVSITSKLQPFSTFYFIQEIFFFPLEIWDKGFKMTFIKLSDVYISGIPKILFFYEMPHNVKIILLPS